MGLFTIAGAGLFLAIATSRHAHGAAHWLFILSAVVLATMDLLAALVIMPRLLGLSGFERYHHASAEQVERELLQADPHRWLVDQYRVPARIVWTQYRLLRRGFGA